MMIANEQVPGVYRRRVGEVLVTALNDGSIVLPAEVLLNITPDERETLLIWGDVVHVQAVQTARPDVSMSFDSDPAQAEQTRRAIFERAAKEDLLVNGMHLSFPGFGRVARAGEAYVLQPEVWQGEV